MHSLLSRKTKYCVSIKVGRCDNRYPLDPFNDCLSSISRNAFTNEYLSKKCLKYNDLFKPVMIIQDLQIHCITTLPLALVSKPIDLNPNLHQQ